MLGQQYYTPEQGWIRKDIVNNRNEFTITGGSFYNPGFNGPDKEHPMCYGFTEIKISIPANVKQIRIIGALVANYPVYVYFNEYKIGQWSMTEFQKYYCCLFECVEEYDKAGILSIMSPGSIGNPWTVEFHAIDYLLDNPEYYLLHDNTGYQTISAQGLQPLSDFVLSADSIQTSGFEDIQKIQAVIEQLDSPFDILHYSQDAANTAIEMMHMPAVQLVLPTEDIDLSTYSSINQITLSTTGTSGAVRVIFSFDGGITWKTFAGGVWVTIEPVASTVITDGITPEHVALIPSEQWATVITNKLRIAYCLSKSAVTDDIAVDTLSITGDTESWKKAQRTVDYSCQLPNTGTMIIELLKDGSYKINYMES